jgi:hypothetical protein
LHKEGWSTRQTNASVLFDIEEVQQGIGEARLLLSLFCQRGETAEAMWAAHEFQLEFGLATMVGVRIERGRDSVSEAGHGYREALSRSAASALSRCSGGKSRQIDGVNDRRGWSRGEQRF